MKKQTAAPKNNDWMYKPILNINTRTDYDCNQIDPDLIGEGEDE